MISFGTISMTLFCILSDTKIMKPKEFQPLGIEET